MSYSRDVVFYASVIVVVILVRFSRDVDRHCWYFFFFFFTVRVTCSEHEWCSMHSCTYAFVSLRLLFLFLFPVWTVVGCVWQTTTMNGRREREREHTIGRRIERERERAPTRYLFFFDIFLLLLLPMMYVRERVTNVHTLTCLTLIIIKIKKTLKKISYNLFFSFFRSTIINVDDQYEWKTTSKKPNRLRQFR